MDTEKTDNIKIDLLDRKLLYELDCNARTPLALVARRLRTSRNVLLYRFNRLKELGIIKGSFVEVNATALGQQSWRILLRIGNCSPEQEARIFATIKREPRVIWFCRVLGHWDLDLLYSTRDIGDFARFKQELLLAHNSIIEGYDIALLSDIYSYPKDFLVRDRRAEVRRSHFRRSTHAPDEEDRKLLTLLSQDAMLSLVDLATASGLSVNTIKKRLRAMERADIILKYRLHIDTNRLGYEYFKLHVSLRGYDQKDLRELRAFLESKPFMVYTDHYLEGDDFEIELQLRSEQEFLAFSKELRGRFGRIIKEQSLMKFYDEQVFRFLPTA